MQTDAYRLWFTRIVTFSISALAAASVVYWGLKVSGFSTPTVPPAALVEQAPPVSPKAVARALGGGLASTAATQIIEAPAATRYNLVGVVAGRIRAGAALISVDGQNAKPVRVGNLVDNEMVLESVSSRQAILAPSSGSSSKLTLEMPKLKE